ncbi:hypothetical protein C4D60_Mb00t19260 [Musa balbisiana]|uniref:Secreted protein n=1 Tax=Musa balbisiana TaxID=52838 RepID=A0A4S8I3Q7_MUSBA|nr:hypothetical protein C4D60_Mb00t19260 [Musa balbisiana]
MGSVLIWLLVCLLYYVIGAVAKSHNFPCTRNCLVARLLSYFHSYTRSQEFHIFIGVIPVLIGDTLDLLKENKKKFRPILQCLNGLYS